MGGFDVVDPRYEALYERAVEVLDADPRVREVVIGGSIGTGTADRWSDLDLQVVAEPDGFDAVVRDWPEWLPSITPTVFARSVLAPFIVNTVTADGLTFDFSVYAGRAPDPFVPGGYSVGQINRHAFASVGDALEYAVAEQMRGLAGPFITFLQRDEHLFHLTGVPHVLGLLTTVFLAETGAPPPAGKHANASYTDEQRATVAALPAVRATREDLMAFGFGLGEVLFARARPLYERYDLVWPADFAAVVARRLRDALGVDTSEWLY